jgi:protein O-GlcNAc transferase
VSSNPAPQLSNRLLCQRHYELGNALMHNKQPAAALTHYDRLLALEPEHVGAWSNRGSALQALGRNAEAVASFDQALLRRADIAALHYNRGNALRLQDHCAEALASYELALKLDPRFAQAHNDAGVALLQLGRFEEALRAFERALELCPLWVDALIHQGNALRSLARPVQALQCYERALRLDPDCAEAQGNCGNALRDLKRNPEALLRYAQALRTLPDSPDLLSNYASALQDTAQHRAAAASLEHLLHLAPHYDYACGRLLQSSLHRCQWSTHSALIEQVLTRLDEGGRSIHPFSMLAVSSSAEAQLRAARLHAQHCSAPSVGPAALTAGSGAKLRLAYVSADLREHAVSYLMAGVFEQHSRDRFETLAISLQPREQSFFGERIARAFDQFVDVSGIADAELVQQLRAMNIDVAVDLMGYTQHARPELFTQRIAPVQVNYLGFPGTVGAPNMDYILADAFLIPAQSRQYYSEQVVYLPECFQANDDQRLIGAVPARAELGLSPTAPVLCCFNNSYKLNPQMFDVWMAILRAVPNAVLWLLGGPEDTCENLLASVTARGVNAKRIIFAPRVPYDEHLARLQCADLFLDTLPFNGGTTASDALRAGLPVLTCAREALASRMAGSLLHAVGLPELITHQLADYERTAIELASSPKRLCALRSRLERNLPGSILRNTTRFCRQLEAAYIGMRQRALSGQAFETFSVPR